MGIRFSDLRNELKKIKDNGNDYDSKLMNLLGMSEDEYEGWLKKRNQGLGSIQNQKKGYLCKTWKNKPIKFRLWYLKKYIKQSGLCEYCKVPQKFIRDIYNRRDGWREGNKKTQDNKKGTRGWSLEIDRRKPKRNYTVQNCVLVCYPCNNAKSDVFAEEEFKKIREPITAVWAKKVANLKNRKKRKVLEFIKNTKKLKSDKTIKDILKLK